MNLSYATDKKHLSSQQQKIVKLLLEVLCEILGTDGASFMLRDEETENLIITVIAERNEDTAKRKLGIKVKIGSRICGRTAENKEPILVVGDISQDQRFNNLKEYEEIYSGMSVPVLKGDKLIGVMNAKRAKSAKPLNTDDIKLAEKIARVLGANF